MYCPVCQAEYREGFTECADCQVPLLPGAPPPEPGPLHPSIDPVIVLESNDPVEIGLAKGLLEDAGIPYFVLGQITTLVTDVDGFLRKWVRIQVPRDREAEARELLESMVAPQLDAEPGDTPAK